MTSIIYGRNTFTNKRPSAKALEHKAYIDSILRSAKLNHRKPKSNSLNQNRSVSARPPTSDVIPTGGGFKREIDDYKWRRDRQETKETIREIEMKKTRISPIWNKGAAMYIGNNPDLSTLGKKV